MQQHFFQDHFTCIIHTQGYHSQAVTHEDHVHASSITDVTAGEIVGSDHGYGLALLIQRPQGIDGGFLPLASRGRSHRGVRALAGLPLRQERLECE